MAAPASTPRQLPAGINLTDGYKSTIAFALAPDIGLWEISVKPPGIDGGDAIKTTTMHSVIRHEKAPRKLFENTDGTMTVAYDPKALPDIEQKLINKNGSVTVWFPDGSSRSFHGYLRNFDPSELSEGNFPTATCAIVVTNRDPVSGAQTQPVDTDIAGT